MKQRLLFFFFLISISVFSQVQGPPPPCGIGFTLEGCDVDEDGFTQFKLTDANGYLFCSRIETDYSIPKFYLSEEDANNDVNSIEDYENYTNISNPQTIYATAKFLSTGEIISLKEFEIEAKLTTYSVTRLYSCDENEDGVENFDLTSAVSFCGSNSSSDYTITYYESATDANNRTNPITTPDNYSSPSAIINVVIENINTGDFQVNLIDVVVFPLPNLASSLDFLFCDEGGGESASIDLSSLDNIITNNQTGIEVDYYEDPVYTNQIDKDSPYNNVTNPQTFYVRATNSFGCSADSSFSITVMSSPTINEPSDLNVCDGDGTPDGITVIDLTQKTSEIIGAQTDLEVTYHNTLADAENGNNPLPSLYINTFTLETLYVRVMSLNGCVSTTSFNINVFNSPILNNNTQYINACDLDLDGFAVFDLTEVLDYILSGLTGVSVSFHEDYNDAQSGSNPITNETNYQNISLQLQTLYLRVLDDTSGCISVVPFEIHTNLLLTGTDTGDFALCDTNDNENDALDFNLYTIENLIINDLPGGITVTFYETEADRDNAINAIDKSQPYPVVKSKTLYILIDDSNCPEVSQITLVVNPILLFNPDEPIIYCELDSDGAESIDLYSFNDIVTANNDAFSVSYFVTEVDAQYNINQLPQFYTNTSNPQTFYVRIESLNSGCSSVSSFDLMVENCPNAGVIQVNAFYDANTNSIFDTDEINFLNGTLSYEKNNDGVERVLHSSNGVFNIISDDDMNTYNISYSIYDEYLDCYNTIASYENISVANGSTVNYNFPITKLKECGDIAVYLTQVNPPRPGFDYSTNLIIRNLGLTPVTSGSVEFITDDLVTFKNVSFLDSGNSITNTSTGFILNFNDLQPNSAEHVVVNMNAPVSVNLGDLLTSTAVYSVNDLDMSNNTSTLTETVVGSYDPNDIMESHGPEILYDDFTTDDYLYYTVRFQNVGTADAINVSIDNTLDSKLDKSTIQMLASSHDYVFTRTDNQLNWQFDDIHLPSESMDEPASHGYVYYKIKPLAGYGVGDIIPNTAEIYFDFNPAVVTNTFETEFVEETTLANIDYERVGLLMYPNPTSNFVTLKFNNTFSNLVQIGIYNIQGKQIFETEKELSDKTSKLDVSKLKNGLYFIKVKDGSRETIQKLMVN